MNLTKTARPAAPVAVAASVAAGTAAHPTPAAVPEDARARLLQTGLRLFAHQGFSKTSTREIAEAASVNVAAISYYFGDKAGLYRAVFFEPLATGAEDTLRFAEPDLNLCGALAAFYEVLLAPLCAGDAARLCMKLRFREMLEPTGLWDEELARDIKPAHEALAAVLVRHLKLAQPDTELQRLVICLAGLGIHVIVGHDITQKLAPQLNEGLQAVDQWVDRLADYALAMVRAEAARRGIDLQGEAS